MSRRPAILKRIGNVTFDEFCFRIRDDQKADLLDGVIHMASPENLDEHKLFWWLGRLIGDFVEELELGKMYGSRAAFKLDETSSPEPDLAFVKRSRLGQERRGFFAGAPDLAIEIVSPESVERDYEDKRLKYEMHGVKEYWIIDEHEQQVTFLRLGAANKYREVKPRQGEFHSEALPGFWFRPEWFWAEPRPKKSRILAEILARHASGQAAR